MIKRLSIITLIIGAAHITTVVSLKILSKNTNNNIIASIGELDSLNLLIVSIIAFGLQLSTTRELAILDNWKSRYYSTQSARLSLSLILLLFGLTGFYVTKNYLFCMAPIIALNADYALYGLGKPVAAAIVAFIRTLIPSVTIIIFSFYSTSHLILSYTISLFVAYLIAGVCVSRLLKVSYFVMPRFKQLVDYVNSLKIGIASFALFFVGIGIINILSYFNDNETIAVAYMALKVYMIFKGIRRIIVQSFFKELKSEAISIKVDLIAIIVGAVFFSSFIIYPSVIISFLLDEKYINFTPAFVILGAAGFLSSFTTSSGTRLLLQKKDKVYSCNLIIAALATILSSLSFYYFICDSPYLIALAILIGELIISTLNIIALKESNFLIKRLKLFLPTLVFLLPLVIFRYLMDENLFSFCLAIIFFSIPTFYYFTKIKL